MVLPLAPGARCAPLALPSQQTILNWIICGSLSEVSGAALQFDVSLHVRTYRYMYSNLFFCTEGMAHLDALNASAAPKYDNTNHAAAPMRLQWLNRHGNPSLPRWVFLRCCGQIGSEDTDGIVRSRLRCDSAVPAGARGHGGRLQLHVRNVSRSQARHNGGDLAHWSCCGARALSAWEAAWDGIGQVSLGHLAANGCAAGGSAPQAPARTGSVAGDIDDFPAEERTVAGASGRIGSTTDARIYDASASLALVALPIHPMRPVPCTPSRQLPCPIPALSWMQTLVTYLRPPTATALALTDALLPVTVPAIRTVTPPTLSRAVEVVLRDTFGLSLVEAASALCPRGAGGDGSCELLAARGDRLLEWVVVQQLPRSLRAECDVAMHTVKYTCNAALAAAARALALNAELRMRSGGREPSEHELGTVVEALIMAAFAAKGMETAAAAVCKLMSIIDALPPLASLEPAVTGSTTSQPCVLSAVEQLMHHVLQLRLSLPLFEVETGRKIDGKECFCARIIVVECSAEGGGHDVILATGGWKASRVAARESAAAAMLEL